MSSADESGRGDDHEARLSELDAQGHDRGAGNRRQRTGGGKRGCSLVAAALGPDVKASCRSSPGPGRCGLPCGGGMEPVRPGDVFLRGRAAAVPADRGGRRRIHRAPGGRRGPGRGMRQRGADHRLCQTEPPGPLRQDALPSGP